MVHKARLWMVAVALAACVLCPTAARAQQAPAKPKTEAKADATKKEPAKPRGRLPAYYNQVVSAQQKERIYAIQSGYADKIEALQAQLKELQSKMDAEVKGVLTPEQVKKVDELAAAAKAKGKSADAATEKPAEAPAADAKPAASPAKK